MLAIPCMSSSVLLVGSASFNMISNSNTQICRCMQTLAHVRNEEVHGLSDP